MLNLNRKAFLLVLIGISVLGFFVPSIAMGQLSFFFGLNELVVLLGIDFVFIVLFLCTWRSKVYQGWLVPYPILEGTWRGTILSDWSNPNLLERPAPIPALLTIRQNLRSVSCVMRTQEMTSHSHHSSFQIDSKKQIKLLKYEYSSEPFQTVKSRSPNHQGQMTFAISNSSPPVLEGDYYNSRKSAGTIQMVWWKRKKVDRFLPEAFDDFELQKFGDLDRMQNLGYLIPDQDKEHVRELLEKGELRDCLQQLKKLSADKNLPNLKDAVSHLLGDLNILEKDFIQNTISSEQNEVKRNKLRERILRLID